MACTATQCAEPHQVPDLHEIIPEPVAPFNRPAANAKYWEAACASDPFAAALEA